jgi:hypothetical protein
MYPMKFLDGSDVPDDYAQQVAQLVADAAEAEEVFTLDELEEATQNSSL